MAEAIRVLHVFGATNLGGAESRVMDLYRSVDRTRVQFDFVVHTAKECYFDKEIMEMGGRIFHVPPFRVYNIVSYARAFKKLFKNHPEIKAVHGHMTSTASVYLPIAKKAGIRTTIAHARSAGVDKGIKGTITRILRKNLYKRADVLLACSALAGEAVFGKKAMLSGDVKVIPNAINAVNFVFDENKRREMRSELGVSDKFVIGHVGSFRYAKNHEYLLKIFSHMDDNTVLLLLGAGELMVQVKDLAEELSISERVYFLGNHENVEDYYQAMDFFVFPSRFEGLPGSVVEAQASGLRCVISDAIAGETIFSDLVQTMSIQDKPENWAGYIKENAIYNRENYYKVTVDNGFDVAVQSSRLTEFYETGKLIWE